MEPARIDIVLLFLILAGGAWGFLAGSVRVAVLFAAILAAISQAHAYRHVSTRLGATPIVYLFGLLLAFIGVIIWGFLARTLHGAVQASGFGSLNALLGSVAGTILAGALVRGDWKHTAACRGPSCCADRSRPRQ